MTAATFEVILPGNALVLPSEMTFIEETPVGVRFSPNTPIEVWGGFTERLQRQQKVIEWALADCINFGEQAFGEDHAQWVDETGLSKRTLQNIARIGRLIEPARRRADVSFSHHAEVITLPIPDQERLLDRAQSAGMSRYDLRDAVRERKRQIEGCSVDGAGAPIPDESLAWAPDVADLTDEARSALESHAPGGRHRLGYVSGFLRALIWADQQDAFLEGRWRA